MMTTNLIEVVNFKLNTDTNLAQFHIANNNFQHYIDNQSGVLYRSLAKQADTQQYSSIIYFATVADAKKLRDTFFNSTICQLYTSLIAKESIKLDRFEVLSQTACQQS
ncbi:hypothetical protein [Pseudoalteromonas sp.]|jgi:hypothetical protein|uniref:hypothetical protein n=1 Tax=Pseudoalteromonas sp. TaxID=53249 RepID=UPI002355D72A|nr:hypothetical protein [Pseudoalteromonas sp.]